MTGIDELVRQHAQAQATAEAAAAQLAEHQQRVATEQAERRAAWDAGFVSEFVERSRALDAEAQEARARFRSAVLSAPVIEAWVADRAIRWRRDALVSQVHASLVRLGREHELSRFPLVPYRDPRLFEDVLDLADGEAQDRGEADRLAIDEAREDHVTGNSS